MQYLHELEDLLIFTTFHFLHILIPSNLDELLQEGILMLFA